MKTPSKTGITGHDITGRNTNKPVGFFFEFLLHVCL